MFLNLTRVKVKIVYGLLKRHIYTFSTHLWRFLIIVQNPQVLTSIWRLSRQNSSKMARRVSMPASLLLKTPRSMMSNNMSEVEELKDESTPHHTSSRKTSIFGPMIGRRSSTIFSNPDGRKLSASWSQKTWGMLVTYCTTFLLSFRNALLI